MAADSLYGLNAETRGAWTYRVVRVEGDDDVWIEIEDAYGRRTLTPAFYFHVMDERAQEARDGAVSRVNFNLPRPVFYTSLSVLGLALATLVGFPIYVYRRRYVAERAERRRLQESKHQLAESREDERRRIARDLHDGPLQDLHALHMQLGIAVEALAAEGRGRGEPVVGRIRGAQDETHTVVDELRQIAEALRPPALGPFGLAAALRAQADRFQRRHPGVAVRLDLDDDGLALREPVRLVLFRIVQEAMTNAAKHAGPTRIGVALRLTHSEAVVTVEDDGPGLEPPPDLAALAAEGHFGLLGMQERVDALDGTLEVGPAAGGGLRVRAAVPREARRSPARRRRLPWPRRNGVGA